MASRDETVLLVDNLVERAARAASEMLGSRIDEAVERALKVRSGDALGLAEAQVSVVTKIPRVTLRRWRKRKVGPPFSTSATGRITYSSAGLDAWLRAYRSAAK